MTWLLLTICAALFKSLSVIAEKKVLQSEEEEVYTSQLSLWIALCSLPLFYFVKDFTISVPILLIIYLSSIVSLISTLAASHVVKKLDVSESSALFALSPIFVSLLAMIFLKEQLSAIQLIGILVSSLGVVILEFHQRSSHSHHPLHFHLPTFHIKRPAFLPNSKGLLYCILLISLVFFSIAAITDKYLVYHVGIDPILFLLLIQLCILINFFIFDSLIYKRNGKKEFDVSLIRKKPFLVNIVSIILHRVTNMFAIQLIEISIFNAVKQISAVITTIIGGRIFTEKYIIRRTIGCIIIVLGILCVVLA